MSKGRAQQRKSLGRNHFLKKIFSRFYFSNMNCGFMENLFQNKKIFLFGYHLNFIIKLYQGCFVVSNLLYNLFNANNRCNNSIFEKAHKLFYMVHRSFHPFDHRLKFLKLFYFQINEKIWSLSDALNLKYCITVYFSKIFQHQLESIIFILKQNIIFQLFLIIRLFLKIDRNI